MEPSSRLRRLSRLPGPSPRIQLSSPVQTSNAATPSKRVPRRSTLVYAPPDSATPSPSLSAPPAFDWDAARNDAPPPFASTPMRSRLQGSVSGSPRTPGGSPRKRLFRKPSFIERIRSWPSRLAFELSMFPHNVPLPPPTRTGQIIGGLLHMMHMTVKWSGRSHAVVKEDPDDIWKSEVEWDFGDETPRQRWSWTIPMTLLLLLTTMLNALYLFTRIRAYQLQHRNELVKSAHAVLVSRDTINPPPSPSLSERAVKLLAQTIRITWYGLPNDPLLGLFLKFVAYSHLRRSIFGASHAPEDLIPVNMQPGANKVQQLEVWNPGELETALFIVYSPAHFLVWRLFSAANWFTSFTLLGIVSLQISALIYAYNALIKDKALISAEVLHEYDVKFVNPRLHGLKKDIGVMTNEAEIVASDDWRSYRY